MANLSHTTKVAVRRAIKALQTLDKAEDEQRALLESHGYQVIDSPIRVHSRRTLATLIAEKAGFTSRAALEAFARKYHLL